MALGRTKYGAGSVRKSSVRRETVTLDQAADAAGAIPATHRWGQFLQANLCRFSARAERKSGAWFRRLKFRH
jgi:hypothetical protein